MRSGIVMFCFMLMTAVSTHATTLLSTGEAVRIQVATARTAISDIQCISSSNEASWQEFELKRQKVLTELDRTIANDRVPNRQELSRLHRWMEGLFDMASATRLYPLGSRESACFARKVSLARAYLGCALLLSNGCERGDGQ